MATKTGTAKGETLTGTSAADTIYGNGGNDVVYANGGHDKVHTGSGNDALYGQGGDDWLYSGAGIDKLVGDIGNDHLFGEAGNDWLTGGVGNDFLYGGTGDDTLRGDDGADYLDGGIGNNNIAGGAGNDVLFHTDTAPLAPVSSLGYSTFDGGTGIDTLRLDVSGIFDIGGDQNGVLDVFQHSDGAGHMAYSTDPFEGSSTAVGSFKNIERFELSDDCNRLNFSTEASVTVVGGGNDDVMIGGDGNQKFIGGSGADTFIFRFFEGETNAGNDIITGFNAAEGDRLMFYNIADPENTEFPFTVTQTEKNGFTTYTSTDIDTGAVAHTVTVDCIGLPPADYFFPV